MAKAKISIKDLAQYMGVKQKDAKDLKPLCEASQDVVTAYCQQTLNESQAASQAMLLTAVWLQQTGITDPQKMMTELPLQVRYFCSVAKATA